MPVCEYKVNEKWTRLCQEETKGSQLKILYQWVVTKHVTMKEFELLVYRIQHDTKPEQ